MYNTKEPLQGEYSQEQVRIGLDPVRLDAVAFGVLYNIINPDTNADGTPNAFSLYYGDRNTQRNKLDANNASGILPPLRMGQYYYVRLVPTGNAADTLTIAYDVWW